MKSGMGGTGSGSRGGRWAAFFVLLWAAALGAGCDARKAREEAKQKGVAVDAREMLARCREGDLEAVRLLLRAGVSSNVEEKYSGRTPLMAAAEAGRIDLIRLLVIHKADLDRRVEPKEFRSGLPLPGWESRSVRPDPHWNALMFAMRAGQKETVVELLKLGASPNVPAGNPTSPLHMAAQSGRVDLVELLLEHKAHPDPRDRSGNTPLLVSANLEILQRLERAGADLRAVNREGCNALWTAVGRIQPPMIRYLVERGLSVNATTRDGVPLIFSAYGEARQVLAQAGADLSARDPQGKTVMQRAAADGRFHHNMLSWHRLGAPLEGLETWHLSLLLRDAVADGDLPSAQGALEAGADPNLESNQGEVALVMAAGAGRTDLLKLLIDRGADPNRKTRYQNFALREAAARGRREAVELLLRRGADPSLQDSNGMTALEWARRLNQAGVAALLAEHVPQP